MTAGDGGISHEGGTFGNVVHPLQQRFCILNRGAADHIDQLRGGLHHIGRDAAGIGEGVVNGGIDRHVFPQELNAYVHQFRGIQCGAAAPGVACSMGSQTGESILHLQTGGRGTVHNFVGIAGMPGNGGIQRGEDTVAGHKGLACAAFLAGAAIENHGSGQFTGFDCFFDGNGGAQRTGAQKVVSAALTAAAVFQRFFLGKSGNLRKTGQCVILTQNTDDRPTAAEAAGKRGGDAAQILGYIEAFLGQDLHIGGGGFEFQHGKLGIFPDFVAERS